MDWQQLSTTSHYQTAVAIGRELAKGNVQEAEAGVQELIDAVARAERRALRSQLIRLMMHVLKWKTQPEKRSASWASSIYQARDEIAASQQDVPSLTRATVERMWDQCLSAAKRQAEIEMQREVSIVALTWQEVFEEEYGIPRARPVRKRARRKGGKR